ncbi:hypothetical protein [Streptomyces sp. CRPSP2-6A1]|uniref:hypothetical protein n=1 Tax=Streptomyces sp. CRPSP2-6A1 TaxID=2799588 RepID=UPI001F3FFE2A|nr:hypothetical protein [Streptomyces sp. CRPSP2-6A1]
MVLVAEVEGQGRHVVVGDAGAADGLAVLAGGLVAFEGAVADVLALHTGHRRERGEFDAAAESLVLVDDEGDGDAGGSDLPGELHCGLQLGALGGAVGDLPEKTRVTPASPSESSCASRDYRAVEARA